MIASSVLILIYYTSTQDAANHMYTVSLPVFKQLYTDTDWEWAWG